MADELKENIVETMNSSDKDVTVTTEAVSYTHLDVYKRQQFAW